MNDAFERVFGETLDDDTVANPFLFDIKPYLRELKRLLRTETAVTLAARLESKPERARLYRHNAAQLRLALNAIRRGQGCTEEDDATDEVPQGPCRALNSLVGMLSKLSDEDIEAFPSFVELGVDDHCEFSWFWYYKEIDELSGLLRDVYASPEGPDESVSAGDTASDLPDIRSILDRIQGLREYDRTEWSPESLWWDVDEQVLYTVSGAKLLDMFDGVIRYSVGYGGDAPGNAGISTFRLCPKDRLDEILGQVAAICDFLRAGRKSE